MCRLSLWMTASALACGAAVVASQAPVPLDIVPVVGRWTQTTEDGKAVVTSNPSAWDGTSGPDLAAIGRSLFTSPRQAFVQNSAPASAFPLAVVKSVDGFAGGTLQVRFKLIAGPSDQTAGIAFGIGPTADYVYVRYNTKDGNVAVWGFTDGQRHVLKHGSDHAQLPLGSWQTLSVQVSGQRVSGTVAGTGLTVTHDLTQPVSGRIGFWTKRDATSAFSDLQVSPRR